VDMDAFYASVEQLDNPDLKGRCVIVGGTSNRGVVSAANYEARKHGVHSAMPIFQAKQLCPQAVFVPPHMSRYKTVSRSIMVILKTFSPLVEIVSIDEAYLDITGSSRVMGTSREIAGTIKNTIHQETGLTCSVGVAPVRFLAKIASDLDKPDGLTIIYPAEVQAFIDSLAIQKVPGIGKKKCLGAAWHRNPKSRRCPALSNGNAGKTTGEMGPSIDRSFQRYRSHADIPRNRAQERQC